MLSNDYVMTELYSCHHAGQKLGLWIVIPFQLIVMVGLGKRCLQTQCCLISVSAICEHIATAHDLRSCLHVLTSKVPRGNELPSCSAFACQRLSKHVFYRHYLLCDSWQKFTSSV